jgi:hypothetical protein
MSEYEYESDIPRIDETVPLRKLHEQCEQVAVPNFDWMSQPIVAIVDGLVHVKHHPHDGEEHEGEAHAHAGEAHHRHWLWHPHRHRHHDQHPEDEPQA